jgi:hypothetical protein
MQRKADEVIYHQCKCFRTMPEFVQQLPCRRFNPIPRLSMGFASRGHIAWLRGTTLLRDEVASANKMYSFLPPCPRVPILCILIYLCTLIIQVLSGISPPGPCLRPTPCKSHSNSGTSGQMPHPPSQLPLLLHLQQASVC